MTRTEVRVLCLDPNVVPARPGVIVAKTATRHTPSPACRHAVVRVIAVAVIFAGLMATPVSVFADERWALIISGSSGGEKYAEQMRAWRTALSEALLNRYGFDATRVRVLADETAPAGERATAENLRKALSEIRGQLTREDLLLIVLLGHGTFDGEVAKFNLVGPDLTASDWSSLFGNLPARLILVNTTESSFPFLEQLSSRGRVVITATDSAAQKYATVFPEYFVKALREASTDLDKNGRTSIYEVFAAASLAVRQHYEQRGQLTTERALLDDNGDRQGREEQAPGPDGAVARTLYLDAENPLAASNPELAELLRRRRDLEAEAEALKLKKTQMPAPQWTAEFEKLMIELAKVSREIRQRS